MRRTIRSAVATYRHVDGTWRIGTWGQTVDVHPDHLAAFDPDDDTTPPGSGPGGEAAQEGAEPDMPAAGATRAEWERFALSLGADPAELAAMTKKDIRAAYS